MPQLRTVLVAQVDVGARVAEELGARHIADRRNKVQPAASTNTSVSVSRGQCR